MTESERCVVSVIVPLYNAAATIIATLESILATNTAGLEIIVLDDGSKDAGPEMVREFQELHPAKRIVLEQHPGGANLGVAKTRNHAATLASGRYLAFLDADDLYLPHRFEASLSLLDERPDLAAVFGRFQYKLVGDETTESLRGITQEQSNRQETEVLPDPSDEDLLSQLLRGVSGIHTSTVTVRRDVFLQTGGFPALKYCEDQVLWLKVLGCFPVQRIEGVPLSLYRIHESSLCGLGNNRPEFIFGPVLAKLEAMHWLKKHHADAKSIRKVQNSISGRLFHQYARVSNSTADNRRFMRRIMLQTALRVPDLLLDRRFYSVLLRLLIR